jgi:DNA-directed RNA polymerase specialized sigma subunit
VILGCFKALGNQTPLQVIHKAYEDCIIDDAGWAFSKTASEKIANLEKRGLIKVDASAPLHTASLDWALVEMMTTASGEKLAFDNEELMKWAAQAATESAQTANTAEMDVQSAYDPVEETRMVGQWKASGDPAHLSGLLKRYEPLLKKHSQQFYTADVPPAAVDAEAKQIAIQAFRNYDPTRGVKLSTFVSSYMPKLRRYVIAHQNPVRISEDIALKIGRYHQVNDELSRNLGRSPSASEVADHQGWSMRDVRKIRIAASGTNINEIGDEVPGSEPGARRTMIFIDYLYHELDGNQKKVLEHLYGLHGAEKADTTEQISQLSGMSPAVVNRLRGEITEKMQHHVERV